MSGNPDNPAPRPELETETPRERSDRWLERAGGQIVKTLDFLASWTMTIQRKSPDFEQERRDFDRASLVFVGWFGATVFAGMAFGGIAALIVGLSYPPAKILAVMWNRARGIE